MAWTTLNALVLTQSGAYSPLPVSAAGGEINVRIPAFALGQVGTYRIGIYSGGAGAPGLVATRDYALAPFERYLSFDIPANTNSPLLGMQLLSHAELQTASFNVVPEWQPVEFSGQFPGNGHLPLALTLDYVIGLVSGLSLIHI